MLFNLLNFDFKEISRYKILTMFLFLLPFYYGAIDSSYEKEVFLILKNIKLINIYIFTIISIILSLILISSLKIVIKNVKFLEIIKKDTYIQIILKTLRITMLAYFIGSMINVSNIYILLIFN